MEVDITDKGQEYFQRLQEELDTTKRILGPVRSFDWLILFILKEDGPDNVQHLIDRNVHFPEDEERAKSSIRRMFEHGYIEQY